MERKIGEIFEYNGEWYQTVEASFDEHSCNGCQGCKDTGGPRIFGGECNGNARKDGKFIIFKKLEKVGEPFSCNYYGDGRLITMQEYQLFDLNVIYCYQMPPIYVVDHKHKRIAIEINKEDMGENDDIRPYDELFSPGTVSNTKYLAKEDMKENKTTLPKEDNALTRTVYAYVNGKISDKELIKSIKEMSDEHPYDKNNLKPFSLELAKQGKPICTRDGRKARIICFDAKDKDNMQIIALIQSKSGDTEAVNFYYKDGKQSKIGITGNDLMMLPEKHEGWVNVYREEGNNNERLIEQTIYKTRKDAFDNACPKGYVITTKINWEE